MTCRESYFELRYINIIPKLLITEAAGRLYFLLVLSHIDYCKSCLLALLIILSRNVNDCKMLQQEQSSAIAPRSGKISLLIQNFHWLRIDRIIRTSSYLMLHHLAMQIVFMQDYLILMTWKFYLANFSIQMYLRTVWLHVKCMRHP